MSATTYLVTGARGGIGHALVASLLLRPNHIIHAGVRDLSDQSTSNLLSLPKAPDSVLHIHKIDSLSVDDAKKAVDTMQSTHDTTKLDVVIANAGAYTEFAGIESTDPEAVVSHFEINAVGTLRLLQATLPLLRAASRDSDPASPAKFVVTASALGSTTLVADFDDMPSAAYGIAKAATNHLLRRASGEIPDVAFLFYHTNLVDTNIGKFLSDRLPVWKNWDMVKMAMSPDECAKQYLAMIDKPASETRGKFLDPDGNVLPW